MEILTVFTDAGHDHNLKIGTWAAWAKYRGVTFRKSGVLRGPIETSDIAEIRALVNGIVGALIELAPPKGVKVIAQTDCTAAISAALGTGYKSREARARVHTARTVLQKAVDTYGATVEYRHVPGHAGTETPRTAVNTWCDQECTRHLRAARTAVRPVA